VSGIAIQASYAAYLSDRLWFFGDDWDFLLQRRLTGDADLSLWTPHNEHWSTVPILLFRLLFGVFGISTYLPYALIAIGAHVAIWTIMFVLLRRSGILAWPAAVSVWAGAFLGGGVGAENMLWDFQVGFLGSGVLGLLAIVFLRTERWSGVWAAWFALVLALASSGVGLVFVGWACLDVLLRRGIAKALITGAVPGMAYVVWFALVGHKAATDHIKDVTAFPLRLVEGLDGVWSLALAMPGAGFLVLAALTWVVFLRAHGREAFALAASGLGTLLVAFALFAYSRSGLGEGAGSSSRYLYFGVLFCAPALALGVELASQKLVDRPFSRPVAMGVVLALTGALGLAHLNRFADHRAVNRIGDLDGRLAATTRLIDANAPLLGDYPSPDYNPNITVGLMKSAGVLDDLRTIPVSEDQLLDAKGQLQVALGRETPAGLPAVRNVLWVGLDPTPGEPEPLDKCMSRFVTGEDAILQVSVPKRGASIWVETEDNDEIETSLLDGDDESESIRWPVESDDLVSVESTAAGTDLQVRLPHGEVTVCPAGESRRGSA
jgi:hypothetical protein